MATQEFRFDPGQILTPAFADALNRLAPVAFGASLTVPKGQAVARKTSDGKFYPLNIAASDGTQTFAGFNQQSLATDASGNVFFVFGGTAGASSFYTPAVGYASIYTSGVFDPADLLTAGTGTNTAEVDTITPAGSVTTGDLYSVFNAAGLGIEITVGATQTATGAVTLLKAAWNADPALTAIATASGTATFILTAVTAGTPLGLTATAVGTGTVSLAITTAAVSAQTAEVDTFTPSTVTAADVHNYTITYPNGQTHVVSATVGSTATATAITTLLKAAWNADPLAVAYATASGTTTFILTGAVGSTLAVTAAVVGTGTIAKVVTTAATGRSLSHILAGNPGAHVLQPSGFWRIP